MLCGGNVNFCFQHKMFTSHSTMVLLHLTETKGNTNINITYTHRLFNCAQVFALKSRSVTPKHFSFQPILYHTLQDHNLNQYRLTRNYVHHLNGAKWAFFHG